MESNFKCKICALIVTYDRPELLIRCLNSIVNQTIKPQAVIIVDNGSKNSTFNILVENKFINPQLSHVDDEIDHSYKINHNIEFNYYRFKTNLGPGFAFYYGCKVFSINHYDWLWMMDDDGYPDKKSLEELRKYKDLGDFLNPIVVDIADNNTLAFGLYLKEKNKLLIDLDECKKSFDSNIIPGVTNPFNGTFISFKLVNSIGLPLYKMFGWGVEVEYEKRALRNGFKNLTINSSIHYHPKSRVEQVEFFNGKYKINLQSDEFKNYIEVRNNVYILFRYDGVISVIKIFILYSLYFLHKYKFKKWTIFLRAFVDGILSRWDKDINHKTK